MNNDYCVLMLVNDRVDTSFDLYVSLPQLTITY